MMSKLNGQQKKREVGGLPGCDDRPQHPKKLLKGEVGVGKRGAPKSPYASCLSSSSTGSELKGQEGIEGAQRPPQSEKWKGMSLQHRLPYGWELLVGQPHPKADWRSIRVETLDRGVGLSARTRITK